MGLWKVFLLKKCPCWITSGGPSAVGLDAPALEAILGARYPVPISRNRTCSRGYPRSNPSFFGDDVGLSSSVGNSRKVLGHFSPAKQARAHTQTDTQDVGCWKARFASNTLQWSKGEASPLRQKAKIRVFCCLSSN